LYTLTYESVAAKEFSNSEMDELLQKARSNNLKLEITGCLIYYMGGFIQVLEGEKEVIKNFIQKSRSISVIEKSICFQTTTLK